MGSFGPIRLQEQGPDQNGVGLRSAKKHSGMQLLKETELQSLFSKIIFSYYLLYAHTRLWRIRNMPVCTVPTKVGMKIAGPSFFEDHNGNVHSVEKRYYCII